MDATAAESLLSLAEHTLTDATGAAEFERVRGAGHSMRSFEAVDFALRASPAR